MDYIFTGIFEGTGLNISLPQFLACMSTAIVLGVFIAKMYTYKVRCSAGFTSFTRSVFFFAFFDGLSANVTPLFSASWDINNELQLSGLQRSS